MSVAGLFAAIAMLLACAAGRDLWAGRERRLLEFGLRGRPAAAALKLGLPERLDRSGLRMRFPLPLVLVSKLGGALVGGAVAATAAPVAPGRIALLVAIGLPLAGFLAPDAYLEREARRRHRRLLGALPDALDLFAVSAASGRSVAAGFEELSGADGPLAEELRIAVAELSCGRSLSAALGSLRSRVPGSELATVLASVERSHRFGSPLAEQLRRQSSALRRDQHRAIEEHASRAAPKIQLVVALVLVPSVLLMIAAGLIANADSLLGGF